jgi:putative DNA primase/helicase
LETSTSPKRFSTWGFKAIAGIGKRAPTIEDRAITILLKRKLPGEKIERLRHSEPGLFEVLARKSARFALDSQHAVAAARPELPDVLNDRAQDNWELLLAIAEIAGRDWPQKARKAALAACGGEEELSQGAALLADIRDVFEDKDTERITSADLANALVAMADRPWVDCSHGKALTQNQLARRLKPFGIAPKNIKIEGRVPKGYMRESFEDAFNRYVPTNTPIQSATPLQSNEISNLDENQSATTENEVAVSMLANQLKSKESSGVAVKTDHREDLDDLTEGDL